MTRSLTRYVPQSRWFSAICLGFACLVSTLCAALPAQAADQSPGSIIPGKSWAAIVFRNPGELNEKISKLTNELQIPAPDVISQIKLTTGAHNGVDESRAIVLCIYPNEPVPAPIALIPVSKYADFLDNYSEVEDADGHKKVTFPFGSALVALRGDYAVITSPDYKDAFEAFLKDSSTSEESLRSQAAWGSKYDVLVIGFQPGIQKAMEGIISGLQQLKGVLANAPNAQMATGVFDIYEKVFTVLKDEAQLSIIGVQLDEESNLLTDTRTFFKEAGSVAKFLGHPTAPMAKGLKHLPAMPFVVAGEMSASPEAVNDYSQLTGELLPKIFNAVPADGKVDPAKLQALVDAAKKSNENMLGGAFVMGQAGPGEGLYDGTLAILATKDAPKSLLAYEEMYAAMNELFKSAPKPFAFEPKRTTINDRPALTLNMPLEAIMASTGQAAAGPEAEKINEMLRRWLLGGNDSITITMLAIDDQTIVLSYNEALLRDFIKDYGKTPNPLAAESDVEATLKLLPAKRHGVFLLSLGGYVNLITSLMREAMAAQGNGQIMPQIPDFPAAPPVGLTISTSGNLLETNSVVLIDLMTATSSYVQGILQNRAF
ncbi:MAG: hypothetical protein SFX18_11845 [Pirellulales bacterium]|nr:hypothetical protein [Pirellulales bacterium]